MTLRTAISSKQNNLNKWLSVVVFLTNLNPANLIALKKLSFMTKRYGLSVK